jgi:hypothetical protein
MAAESRLAVVVQAPLSLGAAVGDEALGAVAVAMASATVATTTTIAVTAVAATVTEPTKL